MAIISEYIGLEQNLMRVGYTIIPKKYDEKKIGKGVPGQHLKQRIYFDDYYKCLFNQRMVKLGYETEAGK